jgi:diadenosine tetraphosphate (Ap4A) HIT family hydrolase
MYAHREDGCLFCTIPEKDPIRVISENSIAYLVRDAFPVTPLHSLVIPKRHVRDFFGLTQAELNSINALILDAREKLLVSDKSIAGFNIGANCDEAAGQTVFHCHIHLIPRRRGDVEAPRGGVRHVIPGKGAY